MSAPAPAPTPGTSRPRLLFVDDHQIFLDALQSMASPQYDVRVVDNFSAFEAMIGTFHPDLVILDVRMPDGDGFEAAQRVLAKHPHLKLMFLSMHDDPKFLKRAADIGALGYISKRARADELMNAVRTALRGEKFVGAGAPRSGNGRLEPRLTERQIQVLRLISQGCSAKEIANRLNISVRTAEFHRAAIMNRLKLHSTALMTRYALEHGLI